LLRLAEFRAEGSRVGLPSARPVQNCRYCLAVLPRLALRAVRPVRSDSCAGLGAPCARAGDCWNSTAFSGRAAVFTEAAQRRPGVQRASRVQYCRQYRQYWPAVARRTLGRLEA
jgi:hypothetical protein